MSLIALTRAFAITTKMKNHTIKKPTTVEGKLPSLSHVMSPHGQTGAVKTAVVAHANVTSNV